MAVPPETAHGRYIMTGGHDTSESERPDGTESGQKLLDFAPAVFTFVKAVSDKKRTSIHFLQ